MNKSMNLSRSERMALRSLTGRWLTIDQVNVAWYSSRKCVVDGLIGRGLVIIKKRTARAFFEKNQSLHNVKISVTGGSSVSNIRVGDDVRDSPYSFGVYYSAAELPRCPHCDKEIGRHQLCWD